MAAADELAQKYIQRYEMNEPEAIGGDDMQSMAPNSAVVIRAKDVRDHRKQKSRFRWSAQDKERFTEILDRVASLNADLYSLVRIDNTQVLANAVSSYLLPQLKDAMSLAVLQSHDVSVDPLLILSAKLKLLQVEGVPAADKEALWIAKDRLFIPDHSLQKRQVRLCGYLEQAGQLGIRAWMEWKHIPSSLTDDEKAELRDQTQALAACLLTARAKEFCIPPFLGMLTEPTGQARSTSDTYDFVFGWPLETYDTARKPQTLLKLFDSYPMPTLNDRFILAYKLASALSFLHASKWLHKSFRSDNIIFFSRNATEDLP
ncbi:hypothetical protein MMC25_002534 [Agyrium rufum]|nr:hypothetical protein [Agyrium rufum]